MNVRVVGTCIVMSGNGRITSHTGQVGRLRAEHHQFENRVFFPSNYFTD